MQHHDPDVPSNQRDGNPSANGVISTLPTDGEGALLGLKSANFSPSLTNLQFTICRFQPHKSYSILRSLCVPDKNC